jgi:hypothetical protein
MNETFKGKDVDMEDMTIGIHPKEGKGPFMKAPNQELLISKGQ